MTVIGWLLFFVQASISLTGFVFYNVSWEKFSLTEPIPLHAVYVDQSRIPYMIRRRHELMVVDSKRSSVLAIGFFFGNLLSL